MMRLFNVHISLLCVFYALFAYASPVLHEKRDTPLIEGLDRRRIDKRTLLPMRIGLRENDYARTNAEKWLMEVSQPDSPKFGQHWTQEQVINAFRPTDETLRNITSWLHSHGIFEFTHSDNKMWFAFDTPAEKAELMHICFRELPFISLACKNHGLITISSRLQTEYFEHDRGNGAFEASCDYYYLPIHLQSHIHYITPGVKGSDVTGRTARSRLFRRNRTLHTKKPQHKRVVRPTPLPSYNSSTSLQHCSAELTPACIRALYSFSVPDPTLPVNPNNSLGIFAENDLYWQGDLDDFYEYFAPHIPAGTSPIYASIDNALSLPNSSTGLNSHLIIGEAELDLETSIPIIYPQNTTLFEIRAGHREGGPVGWENYFNRFLDAIDGSYCSAAQQENGTIGGNPQCGTFKPPNVMSYSYGSPEHQFTPYWQERQCNEYLKLGLQGTSIFFCSQDWGVGGLGQWVDYKPSPRIDHVCKRHPKTGPRVFMPAFPASCPWVTSVGATEIHPGNTVRDQEVGAEWPHISNRTYSWSKYSSGGGFSLYFEAPSYQKDAISYFFEKYNPPWPYFNDGRYQNSTGRYNRNGRGIPDLSAVGKHEATFSRNMYVTEAGTSVATPLVAALFNRIVEERLRVGKGPLGFINPTLYKHPEALHDILKGRNGYCEKDQGFEAAPGWDPMTGLGTPDYPKLLDIFMKLP